MHDPRTRTLQRPWGHGEVKTKVNAAFRTVCPCALFLPNLNHCQPRLPGLRQASPPSRVSPEAASATLAPSSGVASVRKLSRAQVCGAWERSLEHSGGKRKTVGSWTPRSCGEPKASGRMPDLLDIGPEAWMDIPEIKVETCCDSTGRRFPHRPLIARLPAICCTLSHKPQTRITH